MTEFRALMTPRRRPIAIWSAVLGIVLLACGPAPTIASGGLAVGTAGVRSTAGAGPPDPAFYTVPSPLPLGAPGDLIRSEALNMSSRAGFAGTGYRIMYHSRSVSGADIAVTGLAAVPTAAAPPGGRAIVDWAHGTTGTADSCAPSRDRGASRFFDVAGPVVAAGYDVVGTDYEGLGTPGLHPYLVGPSEGRSVLDAARAIRHLVSAHASTSYAIWGHSQGGHATLWATQLAASYAPELRLVGSVPLAPASHVTAIYAFRTFDRSDDWGYLVMFLAGLNAAYPSAPLARVFTKAGLAKLDVVNTGCEAQSIAAYRGHAGPYWFGGDPHDDGVFGPLMDAQEPGRVPTQTPILLLQGVADEIVPEGATITLAGAMCATGQHLELRTYPGANHDGVLVPGLPVALAWTRDRLAGRTPGNDCPRLLAASKPPPASASAAAPMLAPMRFTG